MGDRVAVLRKGELQQVDAPQALYEHPMQPVRRRLHRLARDEPVRGERCERRRRRARGRVRWLPAARSRRGARTPVRLSARTRVGRSSLGIRPEDMEDASLVADAPADRRITAVVELRRGARLRRASCTSRSHAAPALTDDVKELARRRRIRGARAVEQPRAATPTSSLGSTRAPGRGRASPSSSWSTRTACTSSTSRTARHLRQVQLECTSRETAYEVGTESVGGVDGGDRRRRSVRG